MLVDDEKEDERVLVLLMMMRRRLWLGIVVVYGCLGTVDQLRL